MARFSDSCRCGKKFRSMSAEAYHRHNFPALCRHKPKADWEVVAGLEWTRKRDGEHNGRPLYDYYATYKGRYRFHIMSTTDAGFGIAVYDDEKQDRVTTQQIEWRRTRKNCQDRAIAIMNRIRDEEKTNGV